MELFSLLSAIEQLKITEVVGNSIAAIDAIYSKEPDIKFKKYAKSKSVSEVVKSANKLNSEVVESFSDSVLLKAFNSDNMEKAVIRLIESKVPKRTTVEAKLQEAFGLFDVTYGGSGRNRIEIIQKIIDDQKAKLSEQTPKYEGAFGTKELRSEVEAKEIEKLSDKLQKTISVIKQTIETLDRVNYSYKARYRRCGKNLNMAPLKELLDTYKERLNVLESALEKTGDEEE